MSTAELVGQTIAFCGLPLSEPGTGPKPLLCRTHQSRFDGIALDTLDHFIQFTRRTNPVVVGFILPKSLSAAPQHSIGNPAGPSLQPAHNGGHRDMRLPHCVHMVRHDRPSAQVVGAADVRSIVKGVLDHSGDTLVPQPERPRIGSIEPLVSNMKWNTPSVFGREDLGRERCGSGEAPGYKDNAAIRKPMRKPAPIEKHGRPQKTMVCPTAKNLTTLVGQTIVFCGLPSTERPL